MATPPKSRNRLGIKFVDGGPPQLKAKLNEIIAGMDWLYLCNGVDISGEVSALGTIARLRNNLPNGGQGRTTAVTHPFKLSDASVGTTLKVRVKFGMVNSLTPTGMGGTDPDLLLTVTATKYVVLDVTTSGPNTTATAAAISLQTTVPADTTTLGNQVLGLITYTTGTGGAPDSITFSQVVAGSLRHAMCGAIHNWGSV